MNIPAEAQERLLALLTAQPQVQRIWLFGRADSKFVTSILASAVSMR